MMAMTTSSSMRVKPRAPTGVEPILIGQRVTTFTCVLKSTPEAGLDPSGNGEAAGLVVKAAWLLERSIGKKLLLGSRHSSGFLPKLCPR